MSLNLTRRQWALMVQQLARREQRQSLLLRRLEGESARLAQKVACLEEELRRERERAGWSQDVSKATVSLLDKYTAMKPI